MNIEINNLSFKYNKKGEYILKNINLTIESGSLNVLLGLNGCGKTTLIKLLEGFYKANSGTIYYVGKGEINKIKIKKRSKILAYVPQYSNVTADIKVIDYLTYGVANELRTNQSPSEEHLKRVKEYAQKLKIDKLLDKNIGQISGGEKQIVLICCALIQSTEIILLDEPTSALDMKNQNLVLSILKDISKEGKTIILSTHNPNHALLLDSNVILIDKGKISKVGKAKDLITLENLEQIYGESVCYSKDLPYDEISFKN